MARAIQFTLHGNHHSLVGSISDFNLLVKILVENKVFKFKPGCGAKDTECVDIFARGSSKIGLGGPLKEYQCQAQRNWKTGSAQDEDLFGEYKAKDLEDELDRGVDLSNST